MKGAVFPSISKSYFHFRVEKHSMQEKSQETTMTETLRMLNNAKNEIIKRDGMIKRLKHDAECCENEKNIIQRNLSDMHNAHKAIVRLGKVLVPYSIQAY